ncbi:MAG: NAD(P)/FAD-dependent oxidoreductase [Clostridiaceae bacterium]|nr:NAD(P)/FAD-dependent oxidoreductase [Clostridiaceae bacterium]
MYDIAVIGAGVVGSFIARELSKYNVKVVLIEKENDVANGTTKANSAIVHGGYDATPGTLKAILNAKGNAKFDQVCKDLSVPFKRVGSLVVAFSEEEMETIKSLYERGIENNIPNMKILNREELLQKESNISDEAVGALYAPTGGIVGPWELTIALVENAVENGVELKLNSEIENIQRLEDGYLISLAEEEIKAKYVINAAGLFADKIHNMVSSSTFEIIPNRGQYNLFDKSAGNHVNSVIFQCPTKHGKGVVILPTVHGNLLLGPTAEAVDTKESIETTGDGTQNLRQHAEKTIKNLPFNKVITSFSGLRAKTSSGDFIIEESKEAKGFINVAAIDSPGLSAAPAIAEHVVNILRGIAGELEGKTDFNPARKPFVPFMELSDEEKTEAIKKDPKYGRIICRCENITEGEIVDIIHRKAGATTVDGVKKRARAGMGRCQGGFCGPRVMEIIARELNMKITEVVKDKKTAYILTKETKQKKVYDITDKLQTEAKKEEVGGKYYAKL